MLYEKATTDKKHKILPYLVLFYMLILCFVHIEECRNRMLPGKYPYVYVDGIYLKRNRGGEFENVSILAFLS